jgi:tetratricopeptide (TPR) repeat protein
MALPSCSTRKNTWGHKAYHATTAYYNGYFNGEEVIREAEDALALVHQDDYYRVLQVFPVGTVENAKSITAQADKAIKKASVVIKKHSIYIKGKEYNRYIDDAYLLIGKGHFYKRDYYAALEMFNYAVREPLKNNKKDPAEYVAASWLARAYCELGMYSDATIALNRPLNDKSLSRKAKAMVYTVLTDFYLKQKNYPKALESVQEAIPVTRNKKVKRRLLFISAQLMQKTDKLKEASDVYKKVLKMSPSYEMAFYARINMARCFETASGNSAETRALLAKMLRDPKNSEFADQIYYTLGEIEEKEEQEMRAIEQYRKSIRVSTVNSNQKGLSYLAIADIRFDWREYREAAVYYDSAITALSKDHPEYKRVENKRNSLAKLVQKYETIALHDSLLKLAGLSKAEIEKRIDTLILRDKRKIEREREEERKRNEIAGQQGQGATSMMPGSGSTGGGNAQWYFYNTTTLSFGFTEFRRVWGERTLEDNWRRSNKQALVPVAGNSGDPQLQDAGKDSVAKLSPADSMAAARKKYADAIPQTDEMKKAYADSVTNAWYDLGLIYKEQLADLKEAITVYEDFLKKFPGNRLEPTVMYQLYRLYLALPDEKKAEARKAVLLSRYPDSEYAGIISNPEFFKTKQLSKQETDVFYAETYRLFRSGQYSEALNQCRTAETRYNGNPLMAKFALLKALCIGAQKNLKGYRNSLNDVVKNYPQDPVKQKAQDLLKSLDKAEGIVEPDTAAPIKALYTYKGDTLHYYIALIEDVSFSLNDFKVALSDFNAVNFSLTDLQINTLLLGTNYQLVQVMPFENKKMADDYMKTIDADDAVFSGMDMNIISTFIISAANYVSLLKEKKVQEYLDFYKKVYQ